MRVEQEVGALPPSVQEAVEVALAEPIAFGVGKLRPAPMLVAVQWQGIGSHRRPAGGADREREVEVGVAVVAEASIEAADRAQGLAPDRETVRLDRVDRP